MKRIVANFLQCNSCRYLLCNVDVHWWNVRYATVRQLHKFYPSTISKGVVAVTCRHRWGLDCVRRKVKSQQRFLIWCRWTERCVLRVGVGKRTIAKTLKCGSPNNFREWLQYHAWSRSEKQFGRDKLNKIGLIPHCSSNTRSKMVLQLIQKQPLQVVCSGCWFVRPFFFVADFLFSNWTLPWRTNLYNVGDICIK